VTQPLAARVVVVTRPAAQAARFAALVAATGARPLLLPTLEIVPLTLDEDQRRQLVPDGFDWTVYTSANAVECSLGQLPRPQQTRVAAIGRGTARALAAHGITVSEMPSADASSEGLLARDALAELRGRRVLILKGRGGRTLLAEELARRGAEVVTGDVYERRRATASPAALQELRQACASGAAVITATSAEVLANLLALAPEAACPGLRDAVLIVPGERVAGTARAHGWRGRIVQARSAEDEAMAAALDEAGTGRSGHGAA